MSDRPILFSSPMVRALLAGTKTQTRRKIEPGRVDLDDMDAVWVSDVSVRTAFKPRFAVGDRLYVRETHYVQSAGYQDGTGRLILYAADGDAPCTWTPSIHMPRWASRLTLHVTEVRVQRLHDISDRGAMNDCIAEGVFSTDFLQLGSDWVERGFRSIEKCRYHDLWEVINGPGSWDANPWVVAVSFVVERCNIGSARP